MSSRQEEKERRRQERLAQEQAAASSARRRRLMGIGLGTLLAVAAIALVAIAATSGGGDDGPTQGEASNVKLPEQQIKDIKQAARAADCVVRTHPSEGQTHVEGEVTYKSNPPTSGNHNAEPAQDGIYPPGNEPAKENYVHTLEHGRIELQYRPGTSPTQIAQLEAAVNEGLAGRPPGYHMLLFQNNTNMPYAVAATSWTRLLGCKTFNPRIFDAIRAFRTEYVDKAPEQVP